MPQGRNHETKLRRQALLFGKMYSKFLFRPYQASKGLISTAEKRTQIMLSASILTLVGVDALTQKPVRSRLEEEAIDLSAEDETVADGTTYCRR